MPKYRVTIFLSAIAFLNLSALVATASETVRVSVGVKSAGITAVGGLPRLSDDGRYVVYSSNAANIVPGSVPPGSNIFVYDRETQITELVTVGVDGKPVQGNVGPFPDISGNGRYVVFSSDFDHFVDDDKNGAEDIFIRDRLTGTTRRVSVSSDGTEANANSYDPSISANGRFVVFQSIANNLVFGDNNQKGDVFVRDLDMAVTERIEAFEDDRGNLPSAISSNGRYVAFYSSSDFLPGDINGRRDIFVRDRVTGITEIVSISPDGAQGNQGSNFQSLSDDGRYVAFVSWADNLVPDDTNGRSDVFIRDRLIGTTSRVNVDSDGNQAYGGSAYRAVISGSGTHVAFGSGAPNLVPQDNNGTADVFLKNIFSGDIRRVNIATDGGESQGYAEFPAANFDGTVVAFTSGAEDLVDDSSRTSYGQVFAYDSQADSVESISRVYDPIESRSHSYLPLIRSDGAVVAFFSYSDNLVLNDTNQYGDTFLYDTVTGVVERVFSTSDGAETDGSTYPSDIDFVNDATFIVLVSSASNMVPTDSNDQEDVFLYTHPAGDIMRVSETADGKGGNAPSQNGSVSIDGSIVAFQSWATNFHDANPLDTSNIFVKEIETGRLSLISVASDGTQGNANSQRPSVSSDGQVVAFVSEADNLVVNDSNSVADIFLYDRQNGQTARILGPEGVEPNGRSGYPEITADGRDVIFMSLASNLIAGDKNDTWDVFRFDRETSRITLISASANGGPGNGSSLYGRPSKNGKYVAFQSSANDLVTGDINEKADIFLRNLDAQETVLASVSSDDVQSNDDSFLAAVDDLGSVIVFDTFASNLAEKPDTNAVWDVYLRKMVGMDSDSDGVPDDKDYCQNTRIPEIVPTSSRGLQKNRWALHDPSGVFTQAPPQAGTHYIIDTMATKGCSCEQIVNAWDLGKAHLERGCSTSTMLDWINQ